MRVIEALLRDVGFAWRLMRRTPIVSSIALLSLALGIGANVAIFSLVNALMLRTLPASEPDRLVNIIQDRLPTPSTHFTNPQWEYLRDHQDFLAGAFAVGTARFNLNAAGEMRPAQGLYLSAAALDTLGVAPILGRSFTPQDDERGGGPDGPVVIVSYGFWQRELGGAADVMGRVLHLDGRAFTVIGVTPPDFFGLEVGRSFDVAIPLGTESIIRGPDSSLDRRSSWWLRVVARLHPGQTLEQARVRLEAMKPAIRQATMPSDWRPQDQDAYFTEPFVVIDASTGVSPLRDRYRRPLFVLLAIVAIVLLIACANMANLLLAQAATRQRELSVRLSLGASRAELVRQLLLESLLLSSAGALAGLGLAYWGSQGLVALLSTRNGTAFLDLSLDWRVLAFASGVGLMTGLLFGVAPAWRSTLLTPADALREHSRGVLAGGRLGLGHALVAAQVALSFVLVVGAALFVRTLVTLTTQNMGFETHGVLLADLNLRAAGLEPAARLGVFDRIREEVAAISGVEAVAISQLTPISNNVNQTVVQVDGYDAPETDRRALFNRVTPGYFRVTGTPILAGRDIALTDRVGAPDVVLVNQAFAAKYLKGQVPLGRRFVRGTGAQVRTLEIIGLVADAKYSTLREPATPTIYTAWAQEPQTANLGRLSLRVTTSPNGVREAVLASIARVQKEVVADFRTFEEDVNAALTQERLIASLSAFFGALALLLAAIGLYGVMSYSVARRRNEIGIRMALGAAPERVLRQVLGHVAVITFAGLAIGVSLALGAGRFVDALLFNLVAADGAMLVIAAATLATATGVAGYLPARRAARLDPMAALRDE